MKKKVLVAGVGNIFKADDGFGVEVVRVLQARSNTLTNKLLEQANADIVDFGIRGMDLAYTLLDGGYDLVILIDITQRGNPPGTLYLLDPELEGEQVPPGVSLVGLQAHSLDPFHVFKWVRSMGGSVENIRVIACEPEKLVGEEEIDVGLSPVIADAVGRAVEMIGSLLEEKCSQLREATCTS